MVHLKDACPWHLAVVGEGPLGDSLNAQAKRLGIAHRVSWLGIRHDVSALMSGCDLFVLPSAWEGFGLVVAEAMACERPVVATDCGGVREVVGDCGTLVPPRNPEALATAIEKTLGMAQSQKEALGHAGRQRVVARYSIAAMADRYLAVYRGEY
jgi:glycosyltransferase involved in cell wall biosynthesis